LEATDDAFGSADGAPPPNKDDAVDEDGPELNREVAADPDAFAPPRNGIGSSSPKSEAPEGFGFVAVVAAAAGAAELNRSEAGLAGAGAGVAAAGSFSSRLTAGAEPNSDAPRPPSSSSSNNSDDFMVGRLRTRTPSAGSVNIQQVDI